MRQFVNWVQRPEQRPFLLLFCGALLVRIPFMLTPGFQGDFQTYMRWADGFLHHPTELYTIPLPFPINYPPLTIYIFALMIKLYSLVHPLGTDAATFSLISRSFDVVTKLPLLVIELSITTGLYRMGQLVATRRTALIIAAAYAFSPVIIYTGVQWGQTDGYMMLLSLVAGWLAWRKQGFWAGMAFGFGVMSKTQFVFLAPVLFIYLFRWAGWKKLLFAFSGVITMVVIAFLPDITNPVTQINAWIHGTTVILNNITVLAPAGYDFWWMIGKQYTPSQAHIIPHVTYQSLAYLIFALALIVACTGILFRPTLKRLFLGMALSYFTFFCFMPAVLERYSLPVLVLVLVAAIFDRRLWPVYILASIAAFFNVYTVVYQYNPTFIATTVHIFNTYIWKTPLWDIAFNNGTLHHLSTYPIVLQVVAAMNVVAWIYLAGYYVMEMWQDIHMPALPTVADVAPNIDVAVTTPMRRIVSPLPAPTSDDAFWAAMTAGVNALRNGNVWAASRQLQHLTITPDTPADAQAVATAYRDALDIHRTTTANEPGWPDMLEEQLRGALASSGRMPTTSEVITWRTLSVVLPAHDEEEVIAETVRHCLAVASRCCPNIEVIVVDDGSGDRTGAIIDALAREDASVVAIHHPVNRGYGSAVLTGFNAAQGELLFFMDSDGQFAFEDIARLLPLAEADPARAILGIRQHHQDSAERRLNAWLWKQLVWLMLGLHGVSDIDCAFKVFPTKMVQACDITSQGAMINTELLIKLQMMHVPMIQVPVRHFPRQHGTATGANLKVIIRALLELFAIQNRLQTWNAPIMTAPADTAPVAAVVPPVQAYPSAMPTP